MAYRGLETSKRLINKKKQFVFRGQHFSNNLTNKLIGNLKLRLKGSKKQRKLSPKECQRIVFLYCTCILLYIL